MNLRPLLAAAATAVLAGCTVGPNYRPPDTSVPVAFTEPRPPASAAGVDPATWWRAFGDPLLDRLVTAALADNPDIAVAASRIRQARLDEIGARAVGRPTVNATANATRVEFSKNAGFSSLARQFSGGGGDGTGAPTGGVALPGSGITTFSLGFDASWELDLFGGGRRGVEASRARTEAAGFSQADASVSLAAEVAQAYFALRLDQAQARVAAEELAGQRRALGIAENNARVGLVPTVDTTRQRQQITATEARLEPIRADARVRVHALALLTGREPGAWPELAVPAALAPAPLVPVGLPSDLLRRRPDIRAAERRLAAATADIGVAVADLYPRFSLTGVAQLISTGLGSLFSTDSFQGTGSGAVNFPLFDAGRRRATVDIRREQREEAYQQYRGTVLAALRDVEDPLARLDAERRRNATMARAIVDAEATERATSAQYRTGFIDQTPLLDAQVALLQARENKAQSDAQLRQDTAALFKALGGGWRLEEVAGVRRR